METWNDIRHADILAPTEDSASVPMNAFSDVPSLSTNDEVVDMGTGASHSYLVTRAPTRSFYAFGVQHPYRDAEKPTRGRVSADGLQQRFTPAGLTRGGLG